MHNRRNQGFTLIEIMIAVAIVAIIAAVAVPLYQGYIVEARFGTAAKDVAQMQLLLDDLAGDNNLGALEPAGYTAGTELAVYRTNTGIILGNTSTAPAGATDWLDPWGRKYRYKRDDLSTQDYDLFSQGADTGDTSDDVAKH